ILIPIPVSVCFAPTAIRFEACSQAFMVGHTIGFTSGYLLVSASLDAHLLDLLAALRLGGLLGDVHGANHDNADAGGDDENWSQEAGSPCRSYRKGLPHEPARFW